ncbi:hypothetical protein ACL02R_18680 [Streptomyces sp. MS19]|uniref:hypothetical protein n=1 Tax=Streptomyces sp. MS19 TaxID=3385972 RepID=UPI0039A12627
MSIELSLIELRLAALRREADDERLARDVRRARATRRKAESTSATAAGVPGATGSRWIPWRSAKA